MTKTELVASVAGKSGLTNADSEKAIKAFIETVEETLKGGDKVQLVGFGTFEVKERAARTGINPKTKEKIQISSSKAVSFHPGKALKEYINS